jgi:hypothetical protein
MDLDPSMGIILTYENGTKCGVSGQARKTRIIIECSNDENIPDEEEMDETEQVCEYILTLPSKAGCPLQCPLGGGSRDVCSGRGVCGFDSTSRKVRCFCFEGAYGTDCGETDSWTEDNTNTIRAVFVVLVIFVILVLVGSFLMWRRVKSLKLDPKQYGNSSATTDGIELHDQGLSGAESDSDIDDAFNDSPSVPQTVIINEYDNVRGERVGIQNHEDSVGNVFDLQVNSSCESSDGDEIEIDLGLHGDEEMEDYI